MTISDGLMIMAVLVAPFLAVFAQKQIELWREKRSRKLWIFKTLMATRGRTLTPEHVQALNMIDLEFTEISDKMVINKWKEYHDHLNSYPRDGDNQKERAVIWTQKTEELLAVLLVSMGASLGFEFDSVQIRRGAYNPEGHVNADIELQLLRRMVIEWLGGDRKVAVSLVPNDEEAAIQGKRMLDGLFPVLEGENRIKVEISYSKDTQPIVLHDGEKPTNIEGQ